MKIESAAPALVIMDVTEVEIRTYDVQRWLRIQTEWIKMQGELRKLIKDTSNDSN